MSRIWSRVMVLLVTGLIGVGFMSCDVQPDGDDGNGSGTTNTNAVSDTTAPVVTIGNPTNGQEVGVSKIIEGTATDASGISKVFVCIVGDATNEITSLSGDNWSISLNFATEGAKTIQAWAIDTKGNTSSAVSVSITVDYSTPEVFITYPTDNLITNQSSIWVVGTASVHSDFSISKVQLSTNGQAYFDTIGTNNWSNNSVFAEGTNTIQARAIATSGKTNTSSLINYIVDTTAPITAIDLSDNDNVGVDYVFSGTASDAVSGVSSVFVKTNDGTFTLISVANGVWTNSLTGVDYGVITNHVYAVDAVGNIGNTNEVWVNVVALPNITITAPANNAFTNNASITISGTAVVDGSSISIVEVKVGAGAYATATGTATWNRAITLSEGTNTITVRAISTVDITNTQNLTVILDTTGPSIAVTSSQDLNETGTRSYTMRGTASDLCGVANVYISLNGGGFVATTDTTSWTKNYTGVNGVNTNLIYAIDNAGNHSATNEEIMTVREYAWNVIVYLDADNDLETAGLMDFEEIEASPYLTNYNVNVLVLMDRIPGEFGAGSGWTDWTGTRLYQMTYDAGAAGPSSTRLAGMGLSASGDGDELNMGDTATLVSFVDWASNTYAASNTFLILWDHGDGWRTETSAGDYDPIAGVQNSIVRIDTSKLNTDNNTAIELDWLNNDTSYNPYAQLAEQQYNDSLYKAMCSDDTSGEIMYNSAIRVALTGKNIDVIGFDACLMGMIESAYEFRGVADYMIASPELEPGAGWQYTYWLSNFCTGALTAVNLCNAVVDAYEQNYTGQATTTLAAYDLSTVPALMTAWGNYVSDISDYLWNGSYINHSESIRNTIATNVEQYVTIKTYGNLHLDVWDLADKISFASSAALKTAIGNTVIAEWHDLNGTDIYDGNILSKGIAVYYATLDAGLSPTLRNDYVYSNFTQFNVDSTWDTYLSDLFSFPPYKWIGTNVTVSSNLNIDTIGMYQFYVEANGQIIFGLDAPVNCADALFIMDYMGAIMTNVMPGGYNESLELGYTTTNTGWFYAIPYRMYTNAVGAEAQQFDLIISNVSATIR